MHTTSIASRRRSLLPPLAAVGAALALTGCYESVQTSSGKSYLERYATPPAGGTSGPAATEGSDLDQRVAAVAAVEPTLRFPARIGLARIERGQLVNVPASEGPVWAAVVENLGPSFGEFLPINLVIAELVASDGRAPAVGASLRSAIDRIRLGAARQHVDVVLIYEVVLDSEINSTPWSLLDVTIVGGVLGTRKSHAEAHATALLIDVRNGYPYGSDIATFAHETSVGAIGRSEKVRDQRTRVTQNAVEKLAPRIEAMMRKLARELPGATATAAAVAP